jgi:hypothetical protein
MALPHFHIGWRIFSGLAYSAVRVGEQPILAITGASR